MKLLLINSASILFVDEFHSNAPNQKKKKNLSQKKSFICGLPPPPSLSDIYIFYNFNLFEAIEYPFKKINRRKTAKTTYRWKRIKHIYPNYFIKQIW